ncbi:MAG TPA: hypothetical protein VG122_21645 [Gemmata sp.]|nr:hypothetical protein [Gemmata sp.]
MLVAPHSDVERKDGSEPSSAHFLVREIECNHLAEQVSQARRRTGYTALHAIDVSGRGGAVFLRGRVPATTGNR